MEIVLITYHSAIQSISTAVTISREGSHIFTFVTSASYKKQNPTSNSIKANSLFKDSI